MQGAEGGEQGAWCRVFGVGGVLKGWEKIISVAAIYVKP